MRKTFSLPVAATAAGGGPTPPPADTVDNIEHSVRFNSADSAYLSRTPSSAGNQKTWTWSGWVKIGKFGTRRCVFGCTVSGTDYSVLEFNATDQLVYYDTGATNGVCRATTAVYRDPSAWYHIVLAVDTTQATGANRQKLYVNGVEVTNFSTSVDITQDYDTRINDTQVQDIGREGTFGLYFDGYLANIELIDGLQLTPSSFGFTDSNGVWQPKAYTGSYGTNGFHLDFADTSSATALGNDVSGNNNDWTPSGLVAGPAYTANSWSTEFDGTDDYLSIPDDPSLDLGTDDYTVEAWIYPAAVSGLKEILTKGHGFQVYHNGTSLSLAVSSDGSTYDIASSFGTIAANQWYHIAVTRSGNTTRAFLNGTLGLTDTASTTIHNNTDAFVIADYGPSLVYGFNGKVSNVRVIKGRALYTAAFTPPTTALTAVTDTVLLTCQDSTFIDNSASAHTITANGNAATSTVSPFEPVDGSDAMFDSPTNYGSGDTVRGNFCTLNPLNNSTTLSNGNLKADAPSNIWYAATGTFHVSSGKWYWEVTPTALGLAQLGVANPNVDTASNASSTDSANSYTYYSFSGGKFGPSDFGTSYGASYAANDVIGVALDMDNGTLTFYKNNVSQGIAFSGLSGKNLAPFVAIHDYTGTGTAECNFGQQPFKYPAPSGYKSLCSTNLPTPAVADGSTAMDVVTYTGNGSTQTISTPNLSPDLIWLKRRETTGQHVLTDIVRGTNSQLYSSSTNSEGSDTTVVTAFNSAGFELGSGPVSFGNTNTLNSSYVGWVWDAGSSTVSNTDGTITSQVRANPTAGISIVTYNGTSNSTIGHGLQAKPSLIIVKNKDNTYSWQVYSEALGATKYLILNLTNGEGTNIDRWNDTEPTSSVFTVGSNAQVLGNCVAYCFAPVEGFSAFGSYTGSTDLPFVYTGFRPRWLMVKHVSGSIAQQSNAWWVIVDTERSDFNDVDKRLHAHNSDSEYTTSNLMDICSNGFKFRSTGSAWNYAGGTYIYAAFAEHPFKTSRAR